MHQTHASKGTHWDDGCHGALLLLCQKTKKRTLNCSSLTQASYTCLHFQAKLWTNRPGAERDNPAYTWHHSSEVSTTHTHTHKAMFPQVTLTRPIIEGSFVAQSIFLEVALLRGTSQKEKRKEGNEENINTNKNKKEWEAGMQRRRQQTTTTTVGQSTNLFTHPRCTVCDIPWQCAVPVR